MTDFTIDGIAYKAGKINAFEQLAILSKLSPLLTSGLPELLGLLREVKARGVGVMDLPVEENIIRLAPLARELSKLSEADRRQIIEPCLAVVEKDIGGKFALVWNREAGMAVFPEFRDDAILMLRVVLAVLQGTFGRFFPASRLN